MSQAASEVRYRISFAVDKEFHQRLRSAAAEQNVSVGQYVRDAVERRLDDGVTWKAEGAPALTAATDPVLAKLWDNDRDAAYNRT